MNFSPVKPTLLLLTTVLASTTALNSFASPEEDAIEYRQGAFKMIKHHFGPLGAMVKGKMEFDAEAFRKNAEAVAAISQFPINGFIDGSYEGDTAAKSHIADNMDDFKQKMETFQVEAANLAKAAAENSDLSALKPAFGKVGQSCKACHKEYRERN